MTRSSPDSTTGGAGDLAARDATAVLLIAHGSRRPEANEDLVRLREALRERCPWPIVEIAYLELAEPTIDQAAARCIAQGARRVLILPYFLSPGAHAIDDLEAHRRTLAQTHASTEFILCPPLGLHPLMLDIVLARLEEGLVAGGGSHA
jgi:sirohydrochlorin ferrochelatase